MTEENTNEPQQEQPAQPANPLAKYFRQPGISIELPSKYYFYKKKPKTNMTGEIDVYPMTAQDEIILKNPDSLLSGDAIEKVVQSCAPSLQNVRELLQPDVEALLLAIRAVSYGDMMEVTAVCPECGHENRFEINIRQALEEMEYLDEKYEIQVGEHLTIELKPYDYEATTKASLMAFQEARALEGSYDPNLSEEQKQKQFQEAFRKLSRMNMDLLVKSIHKVRTPEAVVENEEWLREWVEQTDRKAISQIEEKVNEINKIGANGKTNVTCQSCGHKWETEVNYDPANFFG